MAGTISIFVFFFVLLACLGGYFLYQDQRAVRRDLLISRAASKRSVKETRRIDLRRRRERTRAERLFSSLIDIPRLGDLLAQSGLPLSLDGFLFTATAAAALFGLIAVILFRSFFPFIVMIVAGFSTPVLFLIHRKKKRDAAVTAQFPDMLDFMVRALRAGQSLDNALYGISANFSDPIGGEIKIVYEEISMGLSFSEALNNLERRFPAIPEVNFLCTALAVQKETGGNLTEILEGLSQTLRDRSKLLRAVKATSAEGRLSILFLGLLPLVFGGVMYLTNPDYIRLLFVDPIGRILLFFALTFDVAGFIVMRIMTRINI